MNPGKLFILIMTLTAGLSWLLYLLRKDKLGKTAYIVSAALGCLAQFWLIYLLLIKKYEFWYVNHVSDNSLKWIYQISGAWAAQEGSFLLWTFLTAILGLLALRNLDDKERPFMLSFIPILFSLGLILVIQSPFITVNEWLKYKNLPTLQNLNFTDGLGLNPALENIWMAIHPPIIFMGFAALGIIFAMGLSAFITKDWNSWVNHTRHWAILAAGTLGIGILLGGFWAYETLGWGGFWGWDPVENASLLPWIAVIALIHGFFTHKTSGFSKWTNLMLSGLPFILFAYGTLITRSGSLADTSVHAFTADIRSIALAVLVWGCRLSLLLYVVLGIWHFKKITQSAPTQDNIKALSWERVLAAGVVLLLLSVLFIGLGVFLPVFMKEWFRKASVNVNTSYYLISGGLVLAPIMILIGISPWMNRKGMTLDELMNRVFAPWVLAMLLAAASFLLWFQPLQSGTSAMGRFNDFIAPILMISLLFFAIFANLFKIIKQWKTDKGSYGALIAHIGISLTFLGLMLSTIGEVKNNITLVGQAPSQILGFKFAFREMSSDSSIKTNKVIIDVKSGNGEGFTAKPGYYLDEESANTAPIIVRRPWIKRYFLNDLYISLSDNPQPLSDPNMQPLQAEIGKDKETQIGPYTVKFLGFQTTGEMGKADFTLLTKIEVNYQGQTTVTEPALQVDETGNVRPLPAEGPGGAIFLADPNVDKQTIELYVFNVPGLEQTKLQTTNKLNWMIPLEVTYKPMTSFVWIGTFFLFVGTGAAGYRRWKLNRKDS